MLRPILLAVALVGGLGLVSPALAGDDARGAALAALAAGTGVQLADSKSAKSECRQRCRQLRSTCTDRSQCSSIYEACVARC